MRLSSILKTSISLSLILMASACADKSQQVPEITESELVASIPELDSMHDLVYPLWHTAYPEKDYALIRELLPQFEEGMAALQQISLPGILRDKTDVWEEGRTQLKESFAALKAAADVDDEGEMLKQTEIFHMDYERLVRILRPVVPELEAFHQELYKLYHYYMPAYDLEKIREVVSAMEEKLEPLKGVTLSSRLSDKQEDFENSVIELSEQVAGLVEILKDPSNAAVSAAIESVHTAYQSTENIFN